MVDETNPEPKQRVLRVQNVAHPLEHARSIVEIAAFIIAAIWALSTFSYQEIFKPAHQPAALVCSASVTHVALANGDEFVTVRVTDENVGQTFVDVAGENVTVWARTVEHSDVHVERGGNKWQTDRSRATGPRHLVYATGELRDAAVSGRRGDHFDLAPGSKGSQEYTFVLPRGRYQILDVAYDVWYLREDYDHRIDLVRIRNADGSSTITQINPTKEVRVNRDNDEASFPL